MRPTVLCAIGICATAVACGGSVEPASGAGGASGSGGDPGPASAGPASAGPSSSAATGTGAGGAGSLFFVTVAAKISPKKPLVLLATRQLDATAGSFQLELQPLAAVDRVTPIGEPFPVGPFGLGPDGSFTAAFPSILIPAAANPINMSDLELTPTLATQSGDPAPCGDVSGKVTKPLVLDLQGSTFTMVPVTTPDSYPEPPAIDCAGDLAVPVGDL